MTTIAYKDRVIAYDSRQTQGSRIVNNQAQKRYNIGKDFIVWAGNATEGGDILEALIRDIHPTNLSHGCGIAFIDGKLFKVGLNEEELWKEDIAGRDISVGCGSGSEYAYGAMDNGATAVEAVKIAIGRDVYSGGAVRKIIIR